MAGLFCLLAVVGSEHSSQHQAATTWNVRRTAGRKRGCLILPFFSLLAFLPLLFFIEQTGMYPQHALSGCANSRPEQPKSVVQAGPYRLCQSTIAVVCVWLVAQQRIDRQHTG
ncbi:hypothetical protein B0T19DRAFT_409018 [Cercophora scortea]|uniref:Uncharacterized protein n=1 Tax=Cercophora scortea TaxID=314031 RepID=A0AAE0J3G3_9PEZI|nr:hypothetical protein B0T19DRAFT_409018 [Cercophora scortea]